MLKRNLKTATAHSSLLYFLFHVYWLLHAAWHVSICNCNDRIKTRLEELQAIDRARRLVQRRPAQWDGVKPAMQHRHHSAPKLAMCGCRVNRSPPHSGVVRVRMSSRTQSNIAPRSFSRLQTTTTVARLNYTEITRNTRTELYSLHSLSNTKPHGMNSAPCCM